MTNVLSELLDVAASPATISDVEAIARLHFGLETHAVAIGGERDRNFQLTTRDGVQYVLKVVHPAEAADVTDLQSRLLLHLEEHAPDVAVPRLIRPLRSDDMEYLWQVDGQDDRRVRVVTFLAGRSLHETASSARQRRNLGASLARIDRALENFRHPAEAHSLLWDIKTVETARPLLADLHDADKRARAEAAIDRFVEHVAPVLPQLRHQMIHNDFNPHNVLVDADDTDRIAGMIDFGDAVRSPLVQDVAVAAAYQLRAEGHPLQSVADLASGFHAACPLLAEEIAVLPEMIAARLALSIAISSFRAARHPDNAAYLLRNQGGALSGLQRLQDLPREEAIDWLRRQILNG